jgi:hypothetical protein
VITPQFDALYNEYFDDLNVKISIMSDFPLDSIKRSISIGKVIMRAIFPFGAIMFAL